jgi:hypothetical protein
VTTPDATCWTLIRDAASGDPAARDRFARVYRPVVRAYLAARLNPQCVIRPVGELLRMNMQIPQDTLALDCFPDFSSAKPVRRANLG